MLRRYIPPIVIVLIIYFVSTSNALTSISAGLAILLFGMISLGNGFRVFNGGFLESLLATSTNTSLKSISFGAIATAIMQSSTLVSVLSISFVATSLLTLSQGIGVIFGANLGNTAGSWLIAGVSGMNISALALPLIVGGVLFNFQKSKEFKGIGQILVGIGFFFLGIFYIKEGFDAYKEFVDFAKYSMGGIQGVLLFVGLGALMTAIVQSSHATLTIIITAFASGSITLDNALAATLGTSIGGVVTALVVSLSANIDGKRLAVANCLFNFAIALIVIASFDYFVIASEFLGKLIGLETGNVLVIAIFHTLFNFVGIVLSIAFIPQIALFLEKLIKNSNELADKPRFLNSSIIEYPDTALIAMTHEVEHLYLNAYELISHSIGFSRKDIEDKIDLNELLKKKIWGSDEVELESEYLNKIKVLFNAILDFSVAIQAHTQDQYYIKKYILLTSSARNIVEAIKGVEQLHVNLKKHSLSKNKLLADEYNQLRVNLALLLRDIQAMGRDRFGHVNIEPMDAIKIMRAKKKEFKKLDKAFITRVESLLAVKSISVSDGTSLLNSIAFSHNVAKDLANAIIQVQKSRLDKEPSAAENVVEEVAHAISGQS